MKYFFIDTENVQRYKFIEDIQLDNTDKIIMFVSEKSQKIRTNDLKRFTECSAKIEYEDVYTGEKNALDFQLIASLSLSIAKNKSSDIEYFVVSNDKDFTLPIKYLKNRTNANIKRLKVETNQLSVVIDKEMNLYSKFNLDKKTLCVIKEARNLRDLHNSLQHLHGNEKGPKIYKEIKTIFKNK